MIVLDVNVIVYALIEGTRTELARQVLRADPEWRLPGLWAHEFLNTLVTYVQHGGLERVAAESLWRRAALLFADCTRPTDPLAAINLALEYKIAAYDAQYLALARELQVFCVTADRELIRKAPALAKSLEDLCAGR